MAMRLGRDNQEDSRTSTAGGEDHEVPGAALVPGQSQAQGGDAAADAVAEPAPAVRHGEALQARGRSLAGKGHHGDAVIALRRAVLAFHEAGDHARLAGALTDCGICLAAAGHSDAAITAHEASLELMREQGNWRGEGTAHGNLGVALSGAGRYAEAVTAFDRAAVLLLVAGDEARAARALADKEQAQALARD
jgi:tetratricopeptide (TPR) repeat protein